MKHLALLALPLLFSSCALVQLPARIINTVLGPLTSETATDPSAPTVGVALKRSETLPRK